MNKQTIGIFGGGQLGRMLAQAALPLGIRCVFLEDAPNCPASAMGDVYTTAEFDKFAQAADVFTLEFENTPVQQYQDLAQSAGKNCYPSPQVLSVAQDRIKEKNTFKDLGITTVDFAVVESHQDLQTAVSELGLPLVLKTTRGGYDGKGQFVLKNTTDIEQAWQTLAAGSPLIAESFIAFSREVSIIATRDKDGNVHTYPLVENHHHNGILAYTLAPAPNTHDECPLTEQAEQSITRLLNHFEYVGTLALELFVTENGLIANEIAPRVHNSGHWSIEGAVCSQFENHMRAVAGLPLGNTDIVHPSVMVNVIGEHASIHDLLAIENLHIHDYNKSERANRKIAHLTMMPSVDTQETLQEIAAVLPNKVGIDLA